MLLCVLGHVVHRPAARSAIDAAWSRSGALSTLSPHKRAEAAAPRAPQVRSTAPQPPPRQQPADGLVRRRDDGSIILPHGVLLVNKPIDWTSFDVVGKIRHTLERYYKNAGHRFGRKSRLKVGHGGTLDPLATGLLVVAVGDACKGLQYYSSGPKSYLARASLGEETDTQDAQGSVLRRSPYDHVTREALELAAGPLRGDILQRPPIYSALRKDGVRMYELARAGKIEEKDMEERPVSVHRLNLLSFDGATGEFSLDVMCSGGTYIRTLIVDMARNAKSAAHMTALMRTQHGPFTVNAQGEGEVRPVTVDEFSDPMRLLEAMDSAGQMLARARPPQTPQTP